MPVTTVPVTTVPVTTVPVTTVPVTTSVLPVVVDGGDRVRGSFAVRNTADSIAIGDDAVWVAGWDGRLVSRIDLATSEVVTVDVGSVGTRVSVGAGGVWVGVDGGRVIRLDPVTAAVVATIETGGGTTMPLAGDTAVWVVGSSGLSRIDPSTNAVTATVDVGSPVGKFNRAVLGGGSVWLSLCEAGLVGVDEETLVVAEPILVGGCAGTVGYLDGSVWVAMPDQRTLRVDPVSARIEAVIEVGPVDGAPFMATGDGSVWVPVTTETVARIDAATNTVSEILDFDLTGQCAGLEVGHGSLWVGDYGRKTLLRIT